MLCSRRGQLAKQNKDICASAKNVTEVHPHHPSYNVKPHNPFQN
jgi:hypothetical protein